MKHLLGAASCTLLLASVGWSQADDTARAEASFSYPSDAGHLLMEAREIAGWRGVDGTVRGQGARLETAQWRTWRLMGDGRLEVVSPDGGSDHYEIGPGAVEQLLRTVDQAVDLPAAQTMEPAPEHAPFVAVHLAHYATADWQVAIHHLDARVTEGIALIFEELAAVVLWCLLLDPQPTWWSGTPAPSICKPEVRAGHGLRGPTPEWCTFLRARSVVGHGPEVFERSSDEVRERLRQRLEALPRGLRATGGGHP